MSSNEVMPGEYRKTRCPGYIVNEFGSVYDTLDREFVIPATHDYEYVTTKGRMHGSSISVHRLLAEAFIEVPESLKGKHVIVNHKDGIKTNNLASNLEWTDYSGNIAHAYATGLRNDNTPIQARNIETDEIHMFNSLQECARHFKVNGEAVCRYLKGPRKYYFRKPFILKRDGEEWGMLSVSGRLGYIPGRDREIVGIKDRAAVIFGSIARASEYTKVNKHYIYSALCDGQENGDSCNGWRFINLIDFDGKTEVVERVEPTERPKPIPPVRKPLRIKVTNTDDGSVSYRDSLQVLANELSIKKSALQKYIYVNDGKRGNLHIEYIRS